MIEHFNIWLFGSGGYEFLGGFLEIFLIFSLTFAFAEWLSRR